jgi:hypothetical protein
MELCPYSPVSIHGGDRENFTFHALGSVLNVRYIYGKMDLLYFLQGLSHYTDIFTLYVFLILASSKDWNPLNI